MSKLLVSNLPVSDLKIFVLGIPQVELDGEPVAIHRRKALALFLYLAVTGGRQRRDQLASLFWPDSSQSRARGALRRDLSELNLALGKRWLELDREHVALQPGYWLDVDQFQRDLDACADDPATCSERLTVSVARYRGDFLTGFTLTDSPQFDEWQFFQTESLRQACVDALDRLADLLAAQHEYASAIVHARRRLAMDPLHEPAHRRLMQLHVQAGQQAAALRQYAHCREILDAELGVPPALETTDLYNQIRERVVTLSSPGDNWNAGTKAPPLVRAPRHNLPTQTTRFIGRERELAEIRRLLLDEPDCRLLNLCGPGGIGKTRLALAAATQTLDAFPDGVTFVSLAPVGETEFVVSAIAEALRFTLQSQIDPKDQLLDFLSQKQFLLIVDNFEHLLDSSALVSDIVRQAPAVTLLVTSRERLQMQEEWIYEVQGLPFPTAPDFHAPQEIVDGADEPLGHYASVQLFLQRARQVKVGFTPSADEMADIGRICCLVEGMPLGLELAAPWIRTLSCQEIAHEIERSLDFLTTSLRNVSPRHHSLYATLNHSWQLLAPSEQRVFACLSVFRGSFTRAAAEQVAHASLRLLAALNDKSLLRRTATQTYEMHEFARQFAAAKLQERGDAEETRTRHVAYFMALAEEELQQLDASWHYPEHIRQRRNQTSR